MAEQPLASGLLDLRPCKLSPNPPPPPPLQLPLPLSMPSRGAHSRSHAASAASPRRAVPEVHSTTELADGSTVFRFADSREEEEGPEPEATGGSCPDAERAAARGSPGSELGVAGAMLGAPARVEEPHPYSAAAATEVSPAGTRAGREKAFAPGGKGNTARGYSTGLVLQK